MWLKKVLAELSLALVISLSQCTGACWEFALEPIKLPFILSGVCSPSEASYCSNPFEVFYLFFQFFYLNVFNFPSKENSFPQDSVLAVLIFFVNWPKKYNVLWEGHSFFDDTTLKEFHVCYLAFGISDKTHYEPNGIPMIGKATRKNPPFGKTAIFIEMEKK